MTSAELVEDFVRTHANGHGPRERQHVRDVLNAIVLVAHGEGRRAAEAKRTPRRPRKGGRR